MAKLKPRRISRFKPVHPAPQHRHRRPRQAHWRGGPGAEHPPYTCHPPSPAVTGPGAPATRTYVLSFRSSQTEKVDVVHTHTPGTMQVLITVLIVCESQPISPQRLQSHLFWFLLAGMVLSTGGPARLVVTNRELSIQGNIGKAFPFLLRALGGW